MLAEERVPGVAELSLIFVDQQSITDLNERFSAGPAPRTRPRALDGRDDVVLGGRQPDQAGASSRCPKAEAGEPRASIAGATCRVHHPQQAPAAAQAWTTMLTEDEIALLVVHGVLHLLNYDHADPREHAAMQRRERELLARFREIEQGD